MTMGYRTDDTALRVLMNKNFRYIGVLGSKTKMEKMYAAYRKENIAKELLKKIKAPVGIPIKSQTPEEIAISIAAEIIAEKNKDQ
jgi:xanthine dehydrogenase accessory factor